LNGAPQSYERMPLLSCQARSRRSDAESKQETGDAGLIHHDIIRETTQKGNVWYQVIYAPF